MESAAWIYRNGTTTEAFLWNLCNKGNRSTRGAIKVSNHFVTRFIINRINSMPIAILVEVKR